MIRDPWWWQHLEGVRIKPVQADPVRFSVCVGAGSRANSSERIVRSNTLFFTHSRGKESRVTPQAELLLPVEEEAVVVRETNRTERVLDLREGVPSKG